MATADGSWVKTDDWKARVDASVTTNNADKAVITVKSICVSNYGSTAGYNNLRGGTAYGNGSYNWGSATSISADQTKQMASKTYTITKTHAAQSIKCWAKVEGIAGIYDGYSSSASVNVTVSAKTSYAVKYDANGGSGAPGAQTKWYGESLTLSSTKPTRTGYTFVKWNTAKNGSGTNYNPGASYTSNGAVTLYAQWSVNTWTVSYNPNGGSNAPASQTKTYGQTLTLRSEIPTLANHEFVEWNTAASGSGTSYASGGSYTTNAAATLYAQWKMAYNLPTIESLEVVRYDQTSGQDDDEGTDMRVSFNWTVDTDSLPDTNNAISTTDTYVEYRAKGSTGSWTRLTLTIDTQNKTASVITNTQAFLQSSSYDIFIQVADTHGTKTSMTSILSTTTYIFDIAANGLGLAIGKPIAPDATGLKIAWDTTFDNYVHFNNHAYFPNAKGIFGKNPDGDVVASFEPCNSAGGTIIGYGLYAISKGYTNIYGTSISLGSRGKINLNGQIRSNTRNTTLWSGGTGGYYMTSTHSVTLSENVSAQAHGIVLAWSAYANGAAQNYSWNYTFIPKSHVNDHAGAGVCCMMIDPDRIGMKYVYVSDNKITGSDRNDDNGNVSGTNNVKFSNNYWVLRAVYGV